MRIECRIDYWGEEVATFDPEKVLSKLKMVFPEISVDPTDQSSAEVDQVRQFLESRPDTTPEVKKRMLKQIQGKARRNGPVYSFSLPGIAGVAGRYSINFMSDTNFESSMQERIVEFLKSLRLGTIEVR